MEGHARWAIMIGDLGFIGPWRRSSFVILFVFPLCHVKVIPPSRRKICMVSFHGQKRSRTPDTVECGPKPPPYPTTAGFGAPLVAIPLYVRRSVLLLPSQLGTFDDSLVALDLSL